MERDLIADRSVMIKTIARYVAEVSSSSLQANGDSVDSMLAKVFLYARKIELALYLEHEGHYVDLFDESPQVQQLIKSKVELYFLQNPSLLDVNTENITGKMRSRTDDAITSPPAKRAHADETENKLEEINSTFSNLFGKWSLSGKRSAQQPKPAPVSNAEEMHFVQELGRVVSKSVPYTGVFIVGSSANSLSDAVLWTNQFMRMVGGENCMQEYFRDMPRAMYPICKAGMYMLKKHLLRGNGHPVTFNTELRIKSNDGVVHGKLPVHCAVTVHTSPSGMVYMVSRSWPMVTQQYFCISSKATASSVVIRPYVQHKPKRGNKPPKIYSWRLPAEWQHKILAHCTDAQRTQLAAEYAMSSMRFTDKLASTPNSSTTGSPPRPSPFHKAERDGSPVPSRNASFDTDESPQHHLSHADSSGGVMDVEVEQGQSRNIEPKENGWSSLLPGTQPNVAEDDVDLSWMDVPPVDGSLNQQGAVEGHQAENMNAGGIAQNINAGSVAQNMNEGSVAQNMNEGSVAQNMNEGCVAQYMDAEDVDQDMSESGDHHETLPAKHTLNDPKPVDDGQRHVNEDEHSGLSYESIEFPVELGGAEQLDGNQLFQTFEDENGSMLLPMDEQNVADTEFVTRKRRESLQTQLESSDNEEGIFAVDNRSDIYSGKGCKQM